jgi:putative oxidoreductase
MASIPHTRWWTKWAPVVARVLLGGPFLMGALFKIPGTSGFLTEASMTGAAGVPLPAMFVVLAFLLEVVGGLAIITGFHARAAACVLAFFTFGLAVIFYSNFSNPMVMGQFISHMGLVAGLLFVSVYGAKELAIRKD